MRGEAWRGRDGRGIHSSKVYILDEHRVRKDLSEPLFFEVQKQSVPPDKQEVHGLASGAVTLLIV
jgi:hypothetical protein